MALVLAVIATLIAVVAWAVQVLGDGIEDPWAWLFAILAFGFAAIAAAVSGYGPSWGRRG